MNRFLSSSPRCRTSLKLSPCSMRVLSLRTRLERRGTVLSAYNYDTEYSHTTIRIAPSSTYLSGVQCKRRQICRCLASAIPKEAETITEDLYVRDDCKLEAEVNNSKQQDNLLWAKGFGSRSKVKKDRYDKIAHLKPGDEGYRDVSGLSGIRGATIVRTKEEASKVLEKLMEAPTDGSVFHACDTEVMDIDLSNEGPVGNGYVTCLSIYSGGKFDYGLRKEIDEKTGEEKPVLGTCLWIDNLDDSFGVLECFKPWLEHPEHLKVWHNYGFDRHVLWNEGIDVRGLGGDTMHMARLQDTSREKQQSAAGSSRGSPYSLEGLTDSLLRRRKRPMKELFGVKRLRKDGTEGSIVDVPPVEELQRDPKTRVHWIKYSMYDAEGTWLLRNHLEKLLKEMPWHDGCNLYDYYKEYLRHFAEVLTDMERRGIRVNAHDYLAKVEIQARKDRHQHMATFRNWAATYLGADGLAMNPASSAQLQTFLFGGATNTKTKEPTERERTFQVLREEVPKEALDAYAKRKEYDERYTGGDPETDDIETMKVANLKALCKSRGLKVSGKKKELQDRLRGYFVMEDQRRDVEELGIESSDFHEATDDELRSECAYRMLNCEGKTRSQIIKMLKDDRDYQIQMLGKHQPETEAGFRRLNQILEECATNDEVLHQALEESKAKQESSGKWIDVKIESIGMVPEKFTAGGAPSVTADVLRNLAGDPTQDPPKYGEAYKFFGGGQKGHDACVGLYSLCAIGSIDTMISNFLTSLQSRVDEFSRVHCSLNFNTETGRLSSRGPNLQNQPALEKDKYKIRKAFESSPGNNLIVADYGQLELRLLASMTNCKSMIEAFEKGGDFHSRTAMGMFDYIRKRVDDGEILFEWDYSKGGPPKPMLKDEYASERRKAKTLNFSIAYGKTAHGLSEDWGVTTAEANDMLQKWYDSRPEVLEWQKKTKATANKEGITRTLMGRYRQVPDAMGKSPRFRSAAERASINTPIQGGAADVAMMAMIKINDSPTLKKLGWILLLQIHDEVILEGPEETAKEAFDEVIYLMQNPWVFGLEPTKVPLLVDGSYENKNWYDAK